MLENRVNCWKAKPQGMPISSQAERDRVRKVQRLDGSDRYPCNTSPAPDDLKKVNDIVRSIWKQIEGWEKSRPVHNTKNLLCKVTKKADLTGLFYDIGADFRNSDSTAFFSLSSTAGHIAAIGSTAAGIHQLNSLTDSPSDWLLGRRFYQDDNTGNGLEAVATGNDTVLFGDFAYAMLFERSGKDIAPCTGDRARKSDELREAYGLTARVIRSQAPNAFGEGSETRRDTLIEVCNTPTASDNLKKVGDIVRTFRKLKEDRRNDDPRFGRSLLVNIITMLGFPTVTNSFTVSRDDSRYWDAGLVGYKFTYRMGSKVADADAFTKLVQA